MEMAVASLLRAASRIVLRRTGYPALLHKPDHLSGEVFEVGENRVEIAPAEPEPGAHGGGVLIERDVGDPEDAAAGIVAGVEVMHGEGAISVAAIYRIRSAEHKVVPAPGV